MTPVNRFAADAYRYLAHNDLLPRVPPGAHDEMDAALQYAGVKNSVLAMRGEALDAVRTAIANDGLQHFRDSVAVAITKKEQPGAFFLAAMNPGSATPSEAGALAAVKSTQASRRSPIIKDLPSVTSMLATFNDYVWGQAHAKDALSVALRNHLKRNAEIDNCQKNGLPIPEDLPKVNHVLLIGKTGVGKSLLAQTMARIAGVPYAEADMTSITESSFIGDKLSSVIAELVEKAGSVEEAERGIVFLDELDKKKIQNDGTRDASGGGAQKDLLKILESGRVRIPNPDYHPMLGNEKEISVRTGGMLFICAGAFSGIEDLPETVEAVAAAKAKENWEPSAGFLAKIGEPPKVVSGQKKAVGPGQLQNFGIMRELVGRIHTIVTLDDLTGNDLERMLTEPKDSLVKQYRHKFALEGCEFEMSAGARTKVAELALDYGTGGRALRSICGKLLDDAELVVAKSDDIAKVILQPDLSVAYVRD